MSGADDEVRLVDQSVRETQPYTALVPHDALDGVVDLRDVLGRGVWQAFVQLGEVEDPDGLDRGSWSGAAVASGRAPRSSGSTDAGNAEHGPASNSVAFFPAVARSADPSQGRPAGLRSRHPARHRVLPTATPTSTSTPAAAATGLIPRCPDEAVRKSTADGAPCELGDL